MTYYGWYCAELKTECPDCEEVIEQLSGDLERFLEMIDTHEENCSPEWLSETKQDESSSR